jgi:hypothetical protein
MTRFTLCVAGRRIAVEALYATTQAFCRDYLTQGREDFSVVISPEDIEVERERFTQPFSENYLETLAVYRKIAEGLLDYDTLLFHGSAVAVDGVGYLFAAPSGTGKSTHARLWREQFGERAVMVNDDKPLLRLTDGGVLVCGTPWDGKHRLSSNLSVPLKAICILERDETNHIEPVTFREAYPTLMQQAYRPRDPEKMRKTLPLVERVGKGVQLYRLGCDMSPEAARTSYDGMK